MAVQYGRLVKSITNRLFIRLVSLFLVLFCSFSFSAHPVFSQNQGPESPEDMVSVKNYEWGHGGSGTAGIIKELTLVNEGKTTYKNIEVEVNFYTANDIPLGSLRTTIKDELPGGSEKTFYNINLGLMHSELEKTVLRVVGGEEVKPTYAQNSPREVIVVKNWEWTGGQYATEGILKEITLQNKSATNYNNIKIHLDYLSGGGASLSSDRAVILDVLPANSEKVFYGVNVGFRHPDAGKTVISVLDASPISDKRLKPIMVRKKIKKPGRKLTREEVEQIGIKVSKRQASAADLPETPDARAERIDNDFSEESDESVEEDIAAVYPENGAVSAPEEEYYYEYEEEEESVPDVDIVVRDFKIGGGSITGAVGTLQELTLENISSIDYTNIELTVDFYARTDRRPIGSNRITINDTLPAYSEKTFRDVEIGFLNFIPEDIKIKVVDARVVK